MILIPVSLARLTEFGGHVVPFWAIVLSDFIYSMTGEVRLTFFNYQYFSYYVSPGLVNVILLFATTRLVPDTSALPVLTTQRKNIDLSSTEAMGYTPFVLPAQVDEEKAQLVQWSHIKLPSPTHDIKHRSHPHRFRDSPSSISTLSEDPHAVSSSPHAF